MERSLDHIVWAMGLITTLPQLEGEELWEAVDEARKKFIMFSKEEKTDIFIYLIGNIDFLGE